MSNEFDLYEKYISKDSIAYDIGAHIGEISLQMMHKGAKVYAFEPSPNNFSNLKSNCENFGIKCFNIGFHEKSYSCTTRFKDCRTSYTDSSGQKIDTVQQIEYSHIEEFIKNNNIPLPDFIKLDIEGMESLVLKTFKFLFEHKRPVIYVEIHAAAKGNKIQDYPDNPHWTWPENGGFDFNQLKDFNYLIIDDNKVLDKTEDYNPKQESHKSYILVPM
jgi:FkbM family methyltransferase